MLVSEETYLARHEGLTDVGAVTVAVIEVFGARLRQPHPEDSFAAAKAERAGISIRLTSSASAAVVCGLLPSFIRSLFSSPGLRRLCAAQTELVTVIVDVEVVTVLQVQLVSEEARKLLPQLLTLLV